MNILAQYEFLPVPPLGEGGFSKVYKVRHIENQKVFALKVIELGQLSLQDIENLTWEVTIHSSMENEFIV